MNPTSSTKIEIELTNPLGDPTAYRIRGAVVALRREQARQIDVITDTHGVSA